MYILVSAQFEFVTRGFPVVLLSMWCIEEARDFAFFQNDAHL